MSVSFFDFKDNGSVSLFAHYVGPVSGDFQLSAAGIASKVSAPGDLGIITLNPAAAVTTIAASNTTAVGFQRLDTQVSDFNARIRWNNFGAATERTDIGFSNNSGATPSNAVRFSVSNTGVATFVITKATVSVTIPVNLTLVTGQWYQVLVVVDDKSNALNQAVVATSSVPGGQLATINQNGAYLFVRPDTTFAPAPWQPVGYSSMVNVPTGAGQEVNAGVWAVGAASGTLSVDVDWELYTVAQA